MTTYHISVDGTPRICKAEQGRCPLAQDENFVIHGSSKDEIMKKYETDFPRYMLEKYNVSPYINVLSDNERTELLSKLDTFIKVSEGDLVLNYDNTRYSSLIEVDGKTVSPIRDRGVEIEKRGEDNVLCYVTRQGGGNRECYCDNGIDNAHEPGCLAMNNEEMEEHPLFLYSEDDDFDTTYASFYFKINKSQKEIDDFVENLKNIDSWERQKALVESLQEEKITPWGVLKSDNPAFREYLNLKLTRTKDIESLEIARKKDIEYSSILSKFESGTPLEDEEKDFLRKNRAMYENLIRTINDDLLKVSDAYKEVEKVKTSISQAEKLPDGELKEYLLGDRPSLTHQVTVGKGRYKKLETRIIKRENRLTEELQRQENILKSVINSLSYRIKDIEKRKEEDANQMLRLEERVSGFEKAREDAWNFGWDKDTEVPPISERF